VIPFLAHVLRRSLVSLLRMHLTHRYRLDIHLNTLNLAHSVHMIRVNPGSQHLGDVAGFADGEVFDLLPVGDTGDGDHGFLLSRVDRGEEAFFADLARDLVMLGFVAERSGHPAASYEARPHPKNSLCSMTSRQGM
jgi:hypothetical protein